MRIAIIGAGRMGKWFAKFFLEQGFTVVVSDKDNEKLERLKEEINVDIAENVKALESADRILICVPIESFEDVIKEVSTHIRPGQEVMDICSVKETPVNIMHKYIKGAVTLGTHPMFGPGAKSIENQNFILTPTNVKEQALAKNFGRWLESRGAKVHLMSPQEHDKLMTVVIGLPYFISYAVCDTLLSYGKFAMAKKVSGVSYKLLLTIVEAIASEEVELAASIQMGIPEIEKLEELFLEKTKEWLKIIKLKEKTAFIEKVSILKRRLANADPQYIKSYEHIYKMFETFKNEC